MTLIAYNKAAIKTKLGLEVTHAKDTIQLSAIVKIVSKTNN